MTAKVTIATTNDEKIPQDGFYKRGCQEKILLPFRRKGFYKRGCQEKILLPFRRKG